MSYITVLKSVPEILSQPAGIAAIASLGIHGAIALLLPLMPVDSAKSTKQAPITKPLGLAELTPFEQSRIPQVATLQPGAPNALLPLPAQGQISGQTGLPGMPNSTGSTTLNSSNSFVSPPSGAPFVSSTTPPLQPFQQTTGFLVNPLPNQGKVVNSRTSRRTSSSPDYSNINFNNSKPVIPPNKMRGVNPGQEISFPQTQPISPTFTPGNNAQTQPMGEDEGKGVNLAKDPFANMNNGQPAGNAVATNPDGTQAFAPLESINNPEIKTYGGTPANPVVSNPTNVNNSLSGTYASNLKTGDSIINQITKFKTQYKDLVTAAPITLTSDSNKISGIVDGGMVIKNKAGEVDAIELADGSQPPKEVRDAVLSYLQKSPIAAINGKPTYVSFRISPKSGDAATQTPVKSEDNTVQKPVVLKNITETLKPVSNQLQQPVIPSSTVPGTNKPVEIKPVQQTNSQTTSEVVKPIDKLRQRMRTLSQSSEMESSKTQVFTQETGKPESEKATTNSVSTDGKPFLNELRKFRDQEKK
ncbi:hypothetical protein [Calothrix sp. PCC 6303]|uniref:hypothetical protein n=1 Tax=Calothrix sp. PCC 6303 TaxID=1170562 RepID=UPI0002A00187|nr:hypothetical protein [Calothrix sp. PCC 6303]AFZ02981.1 hypothetical protein Cal6303_4065 [Calothrix sp. PCC 6303]